MMQGFIESVDILIVDALLQVNVFEDYCSWNKNERDRVVRIDSM